MRVSSACDAVQCRRDCRCHIDDCEEEEVPKIQPGDVYKRQLEVQVVARFQLHSNHS